MNLGKQANLTRRLAWPGIVLIALSLNVVTSVSAQVDNYPEQPITLVVGFGVGGSADLMARLVSQFFAAELGQPVRVINRPGAGTLLGANYVLGRPDDGYTIFASTFSPYLSNTILEGNATYTINDFAYINFQWFDEDLFALSKASQYSSLEELIDTIRNKPKTVRAAVVRGSAGHLMAKLLLEANDIPQENLNLVAYNSGGQARAAVAGGVVDLIVISAEGSESIREYITPVAIVSDRVDKQWAAPTLNQALAKSGLSAPVLPGSIRGFATSADFKNQYPERFEFVVAAMQRALQNVQLQEQLDSAAIGGRWTGPDQATKIMAVNYALFKNYSYLLELER